jgi:hypothetical protein
MDMRAEFDQQTKWRPCLLGTQNSEQFHLADQYDLFWNSFRSPQVALLA